MDKYLVHVPNKTSAQVKTASESNTNKIYFNETTQEIWQGGKRFGLGKGIITDIGWDSTNNYLTYKEDGTVKTRTIPYASNAGNSDSVDLYHVYNNGRPYKYQHTFEQLATDGEWYIRIQHSAYSLFGTIILYTAYNNSIEYATIDIFGFNGGFFYRGNCQNGPIIKGICCRSSRVSNDEPYSQIWLKMMRINNVNHYSLSSKATVTICCTNHDFTATPLLESPDITYKDTSSALVSSGGYSYGTVNNAEKLGGNSPSYYLASAYNLWETVSS